MLVRMADGRATFIDFRERAPEKASRNMYLDAKGELTKDSIEGWRSSGVPGTVRGFEMALAKYGKRKWAENLAPAVELASKGFPGLVRARREPEGIEEPGGVARIEAHLPEERRVLRRRRDARAAGAGADARADLRRTAPTEFYEGETAKRFAAEMAKHGGIDHARRSEGLQGDRAHAALRHAITATRSSPRRRRARAASRCSRCSASSTAPATRRAAPARRRPFTTSPKRCAAPTPTATSTSAIPAFVKVPIAGLLDPAYLARLRALDRSGARDAERPGASRQAVRHRADGNDALLGGRRRGQRGRRDLHAERRLRQRHHRARARASC